MQEELDTHIAQVLTGFPSLTLILPICVAEELGVRNGEVLKCYVNHNRLIVEKKFSNDLIGENTVRTRSSSMSDHKMVSST